ncbi:MAG TPA: hypothetical protein VI685_21580 [Candidatus Angelobacter sp.]
MQDTENTSQVKKEILEYIRKRRSQGADDDSIKIEVKTRLLAVSNDDAVVASYLQLA